MHEMPLIAFSVSAIHMEPSGLWQWNSVRSWFHLVSSREHIRILNTSKLSETIQDKVLEQYKIVLNSSSRSD